MSPAQIVLSPGHVHVWTTRLDDCQDPALLERYASFLSDDERARWQRFVFPRDRQAFLVARALVRSVLGRVLGVQPAQLRFDAGEHGKPRLADALVSSTDAPLSFNLSHTRGIAILAVTSGLRQVGVDVESTARPPSLDVAERFFSASESQALRARAPSDQAERFWSLWTLKESYLKATGQGLHAALDEFSFCFSDQARRISLSGQAGWQDCANRWWIGQWLPSPSHMAALCIEQGDHPSSPIVHAHELTPLQHERPGPLAFIRTTS